MNKIDRYFSPTLKVITLAVEVGFALSDIGYSGWEDGPATDGNSNDLGDF